MSGEDNVPPASFESAKARKPGPVVALETTGHISFVIPNANELNCTEVKSAQQPIGGLLWQLAASKEPAPNGRGKSALLVRLFASHPSGRTANWAATAKAVVTVQSPPGTERPSTRDEFTVSYGEWKDDETDCYWEVLEGEYEDYIDAGKNSLSLGCEIEISKVYGVGQPLRALFNEESGFSDVCLVVGGKKFYVSRSLVSVHSEVLSSMLMGNFAEGEKKEIELKEVDPDGFEAFLNLVYLVSPDVKVADLEKVLAVANYLCVYPMIAKCAEILLSETTGLTIEKRLLISDKFNLPVFFDILESAANNVENVLAFLKTEDGLKLSKDANVAILRKMLQLPLLNPLSTSSTGRLRVDEVASGGYTVRCSKCQRIVYCKTMCPQCP